MVIFAYLSHGDVLISPFFPLQVHIWSFYQIKLQKNHKVEDLAAVQAL